MFLSIVIPHYNLSQALLKRCIDSILAINMPIESYEIIIVDDGSAMPPRWINSTYSSGNIRLIESEHGNLGAARNRGIEEAQGEYIQFVDADDALHPSNAMQQCMEKLKEEHPDILRFKYKICPAYKASKSMQQQRVKFGNTTSGALHMASKNLTASVCSYFVRKKLLDKKGIRFTTGIYHEDEEFSTIAHFHAKTLIESNAHIYNYCIRNSSITTDNNSATIEKRLGDRMTVLEKLATFKAVTNEQSNTIQKKALRRKLTTLVVDMIINMLRAGKSATQIHTTCTEHITPLMLYPIPSGNYGLKFNIFRLLANSKRGLHILRFLLSSTHKPATK